MPTRLSQLISRIDRWTRPCLAALHKRIAPSSIPSRWGRQVGFWALALLVGMSVSGCLTIKRRTLVIALPEDSKEIRLYYQFAGLGVHRICKYSGADPLPLAKDQLKELRKDGFGFFIQLPAGVNVGETEQSTKLIAQMKFEPLRTFADPSAERPLSADRRVVIADRDRFIADLNHLLNGNIDQSRQKQSVDQLRRSFAQSESSLSDTATKEIVDAFGAQPLLQVAEALLQVSRRLDDASLEIMAKQEKYEPIRLRPGSIVLVLPTTKQWAKEYVATPHAAETVARLEKLVKPVALEASDDGLLLVVGKPGVPIVLTYDDPRKQDPVFDAELQTVLGSPTSIMNQGKQLTAAEMIQQFLAEQRPKGKAE